MVLLLWSCNLEWHFFGFVLGFLALRYGKPRPATGCHAKLGAQFGNGFRCSIANCQGWILNGIAVFGFDQESITPGTDTDISFSTTISGAENIVVFVYYDNDDNGEDSDGDDLNSYENITLEEEGADIELTPYY